MAICVEFIRLCRSEFARASSSTRFLNSALTVVSSSLTDCSSSRLVSNSSPALRSSSFMACNSSLLALSSSEEASYCSTVSRRWELERVNSRSSCCTTATGSSVPYWAGASVAPGMPGSCSSKTTSKHPGARSPAGEIDTSTARSPPASFTKWWKISTGSPVSAARSIAARNSTRSAGWINRRRLRVGSPSGNWRKRLAFSERCMMSCSALTTMEGGPKRPRSRKCSSFAVGTPPSAPRIGDTGGSVGRKLRPGRVVSPLFSCSC